MRNKVDIMKKTGIPQSKGLPEEQNAAAKKMQSMSGAAFDHEFVGMMVQGHQKAIDLFRHEAATGQNNDVRDYAKNTLPTLEKHLKNAQDLQSKMGTKH